MIPLQLARENHAELSAGRARGAPGRAASPNGNERRLTGLARSGWRAIIASNGARGLSVV